MAITIHASAEEVRLAEEDAGLADRIRRATRLAGIAEGEATIHMSRIIGARITVGGEQTSLATLYAYHWGAACKAFSGRVPSRKAVWDELAACGTHPARVTDAAIMLAVQAVLTT
ncbi:hypothetical protein ACTQ43_14160 [Segatella copri]